jgi:hypothetical protein
MDVSMLGMFLSGHSLPARLGIGTVVVMTGVSREQRCRAPV